MTIRRGEPRQLATLLTVLAGAVGGYAGLPEAVALARPVGRPAQEELPAIDGSAGAADKLRQPARPEIVGDVFARRFKGPHPKVAPPIANAAKAADHAGVPGSLGVAEVARRGSISLDVAAASIPAAASAIRAGHARPMGGRGRPVKGHAFLIGVAKVDVARLEAVIQVGPVDPGAGGSTLAETARTASRLVVQAEVVVVLPWLRQGFALTAVAAIPNAQVTLPPIKESTAVVGVPAAASVPTGLPMTFPARKVVVRRGSQVRRRTVFVRTTELKVEKTTKKVPAMVAPIGMTGSASATVASNHVLTGGAGPGLFRRPKVRGW